MLPHNPLKQLKLRRPIVAEAVDRRVVVNHARGRALLTAVRNTYLPWRPTSRVCTTPRYVPLRLVLLGSPPDAGGAWTDSGQANEDRQLKHRGVNDTRPVPASPELVEILRQHIETFPTSPDGRLFVTRVGRAGVPLPPPFAKPLSMGTTYRVWATARAAALTHTEFTSPLAKCPYNLRHPAVSLWLNAGVPPTQVAEWAGWAEHSVNVLLRVYAKCVYGQDEIARIRIEAALAQTTAVGEPDVAVTSSRTAVDSLFGPVTAGSHERAPDPRFRRSGALSARGGR